MKIRKIEIKKDTTADQYFESFRNLTKDLYKYLVMPMSIEMNNIFHLRKKAWELKNTRHKQVGSLDMSKIYAYKTSDNLFKKNTWKPEGKSHGVVIALDFSSSMHSTIMSCVLNAAAITVFCKKNKIPCKVVTFTTHGLSNTAPSTLINTGMNSKGIFGISNNFDSKILFDDKMKEYDILTTFYNLFLMVNRDNLTKMNNGFKHRSEIVNRYSNVSYLNMNSTPLSMGMWCGIDNAMEMKKTVQQVTLLTISDGMGNQHFSSGAFNCIYNNEVYTVEHMHKQALYPPKKEYKFEDNEIIMMNEICKDLGINSIHINLTTNTNVSTTYPLTVINIPQKEVDTFNKQYQNNGYVVVGNLLNFNKTLFINQNILDRFIDDNITFEETKRHKIASEKTAKVDEMSNNINGLKKILKKSGSDLNTVKEISRVVVEEICKWYH